MRLSLIARRSLFISRPLTRTSPRATMSTAAPAKGSAQKPKPSDKKEIKILMLHGYTQSGPLFRTKTRAMEKLLAKMLAPVSILPTLIYPTGPNNLRPQDIPGYLGDAPQPEGGEDTKSDAWAWFRKDEGTGTYRFLEQGMNTVAETIKEAGGVDGVCGFSQGGGMAGLVTAALEPSRALPDGKDAEWVQKMREANGGAGLKFSIVYAGFFAPVDSLKWCYEPKIRTPTLHILGGLDTVVEESRSRGLIDRCEDPVVLVHPGGHYVPVSKEWVMPVAGFIKEHGEDKLQPGL